MGLIELDLTGQTIDGRFFVERRIGAGGMGTVWRVQHVQSLQHFALKTLRVSDEFPQSAIRRCLKEARAAASLRSRHVVKVIDVHATYVHQDVPLPYLVMELLEGIDFESLLAKRRTLEIAETHWVMQQLCRGIQLAHDHGVVHRDLKPANLFLTRDDDGEPVLKICDFGLAKGSSEGRTPHSDTLSTGEGTVLGTPRYMAPEQLRGAANTTGAVDQWSIGLIAYRLLSGRDYFDGAQNAVELSLRIVHDELPVPSQSSRAVPSTFDQWFLRSCARDPAQRHASVQVQADGLHKALGAPTPTAIDPLDRRGAVELDLTGTGASTALAARSSATTVPRATARLYAALGFSAVIAVISAAGFARFLGQLKPRDGARTARDAKPSSGPSIENALSDLPPRYEASSSASGAPDAEAAPRREVKRRTAEGRRLSPPTSVLSARTTSTSATSESLPSTPAIVGFPSGSTCRRSSECESRLCVAERCR
jgi:serine/threonine protein kinase